MTPKKPRHCYICAAIVGPDSVFSNPNITCARSLNCTNAFYSSHPGSYINYDVHYLRYLNKLWLFEGLD